MCRLVHLKEEPTRRYPKFPSHCGYGFHAFPYSKLQNSSVCAVCQLHALRLLSELSGFSCTTGNTSGLYQLSALDTFTSQGSVHLSSRSRRLFCVCGSWLFFSLHCRLLPLFLTFEGRSSWDCCNPHLLPLYLFYEPVTSSLSVIHPEESQSELPALSSPAPLPVSNAHFKMSKIGTMCPTPEVFLPSSVQATNPIGCGVENFVATELAMSTKFPGKLPYVISALKRARHLLPFIYS